MVDQIVPRMLEFRKLKTAIFYILRNLLFKNLSKRSFKAVFLL